MTWGRITCQLYTLTIGENHLLSPTWNVSKSVLDVFSLAQSFIFTTYCLHLCGYSRILQVFPIWESFFVARTTISPHHDSNAWIILNLTPRSLSSPLLVALGRHFPGRNQVRREISWNLVLSLLVSAWPGWAPWCPCPLDQGPSPGSSPCSATCGFPCWYQGWEAHFPQPILKGKVTG